MPNPPPLPPPPPHPTLAQLRETAARYAATVTARNADDYAALFTPDAVQVDPYPSPPNEGREAIRAFMQRSIDSSESLLFELVEVHQVADRVAISFHITLTLAGATTMHIRGIEIFTVTADGLISAVEAYWGDEDIQLG